MQAYLYDIGRYRGPTNIMIMLIVIKIGRINLYLKMPSKSSLPIKLNFKSTTNLCIILQNHRVLNEKDCKIEKIFNKNCKKIKFELSFLTIIFLQSQFNISYIF